MDIRPIKYIAMCSHSTLSMIKYDKNNLEHWIIKLQSIKLYDSDNCEIITKSQNRDVYIMII